jgi:prophage regulatory protein
MLLGIAHPAASQVRVDAIGHRHRSDRHTSRAAGSHHLRFELGAVFAPASPASADFVGNSVHVSTKSLVDTSILKRSTAIKLPRLDAYAQFAMLQIDQPHATPPFRTEDVEFLRMPSVTRRTGLARSTIYRLIAEQSFPSPVKLAGRAVGWRRVDLDRWSESRPSSKQ